MFLLVTVRHVGAHPDELQHGVSIQSSINLGKTFPRISRIQIIPSTQILARVFVYWPPFISQILDFIFICRMVVIFILIYFEWRDTGNQQLFPVTAKSRARTTDFFWGVYFFSFMAYGCKPCHVSNVPVTPLMKSQSRNVWRGGLESLLLKTLSKVWKRDPDPAFPLTTIPHPELPSTLSRIPFSFPNTSSRAKNLAKPAS